MEPTIIPFVHKSLDIIETTLSIFEAKLGLPAGALLKFHAAMDPSGSEARTIKSPPKYVNSEGTIDKDGIFHGAHTDFGSLSFLHNRLGGLQVLPPGSSDWQFVRPLPGHAICNIGDALTLFSGGILRSSLHRVVPPPGTQASHTRWSVVFFSRPSSNSRLCALEESESVREALSRMDPEERARYQADVTQGEWYARRMMNTRLKNRKVSLYHILERLAPIRRNRGRRRGMRAEAWSTSPMQCSRFQIQDVHLLKLLTSIVLLLSDRA